jgi:hypothetical protein
LDHSLIRIVTQIGVELPFKFRRLGSTNSWLSLNANELSVHPDWIAGDRSRVDCARNPAVVNIAVPGVIHDNVETSKCGNRRLHGRLSGAFICHVQRNRANAVAVFFYQVIKSLRVACCGDESIAGFEYSLRNVSAQTARAAGD